MNLDQRIEAVLFASAKPATVKRLADIVETSPSDVEAALNVLQERLDASGSGIMLQMHESSVELVTRPEAGDTVARVMNAEVSGELSRPSLETLTILAYCGPMTRPELEQVRGVQSSMILRNLMLRGLVQEQEHGPLGQPVYAVTFDFLNHLGLSSVESLADYAELRGHAAVADVLEGLKPMQPELQSTTETSSLDV